MKNLTTTNQKKNLIGSLIFLLSFIIIVSENYAQIEPETERRLVVQELANNERKLGELENKARSITKDIVIRPERKIPTVLQDLLLISKEEKVELSKNLNEKKLKFVKVWNNTCGGNKTINYGDENCLSKRDYHVVSAFSPYLKTHLSQFAYFEIENGEILTPITESSLQLLLDLGDVPLSKLNKNSIEVSKIKKVKINKKDYKENEKLIANKIEFDGLTFSNKANLKNDHTFLVRSIFYHYLEQDKIYAIRIISELDGFVTIAWKEIQ